MPDPQKRSVKLSASFLQSVKNDPRLRGKAPTQSVPSMLMTFLTRGIQAPAEIAMRADDARRREMQLQRQAAGKPMSRSETARVIMQQGKQRIAQAPAGVASITVANSARKGEKGAIGGYRPAIVDALPAFAGTVGTLSELAGIEGAAPDEGTFLRNSMERMSLADDRTNEALGITAPQDAVDMFLNLAGANVPGVNLTKLSKLGKLGKATQIGAELTLPLRQTNYLDAAAVTIPAGVALREGIDTAVSDPNYRGAFGINGSTDTQSISPVVGDGTTQQEPVDELEQFAADVENMDEAGNAITRDIGMELEDAFAEEDEAAKQDRWTQAAITLGALALGVKAAQMGRQAIKNGVSGAALSTADPTVIGKTKVQSKAGGLRTAAFDAQRPIRSAVDEFLTPAQAKQYGYNLDTISNTAIGAQVRHGLNTGILPGSTKKYTPVTRVIEPMAQELKPEQTAMLGDALLFASALDDYKATGVQAAFIDYTPQQMQALVDKVKNDPITRKYFDGVQKLYSDLLDYEVDIGKYTAREAAQFKAANPNYVHMSRDLDTGKPITVTNEKIDANTETIPALVRNADALAGVQKGAVRNPIDEIADRYRDAVRWGRLNELRRNALDDLHQSGGKALSGKPLVKRLPDGEKPKGSDKWGDSNYHLVRENGKDVYYQVNDPALNTAMRFNSRFGIKPLEAWRQLYQSATTGVLALPVTGFGAFVSPIYDTTIGMILRPKGTDLGLINEALNRISKGKFSLTARLGNDKLGGSINLDPTAAVSAYTGALRYMFDDFTRAAADNLSNQLVRENSWLRTAIGDQGVTALRDKFQQSYETSIKAMGDELGIFSHTMRGSPDSEDVVAGLDDIAPNFAVDQGKRIAKQAAQDPRWYAGALSNSKSAWVRTRASTIGRTAQLLTEAMHNGFRYSTLATNKDRIKNLDELASTARRISVDASKHGESNAVNLVVGSTNYSNIAMQSFYELGRRIKEAPVNTTLNMMTVLGGYAAMHYAALASDPVAQEQHKAKRPDQRTATVTTFGGAELPVEPLMRVPWSLLSTYLDEVSGANAGFYNPDFLSAIDTWFDPLGEGEQAEAYRNDQVETLKSAFINNSPWTPTQMPFIATSMAMIGIDPSYVRMETGEAGTPKVQTVSGFDTDKQFKGGLMSAYMENILTSALGAVVGDALRMADEVYRSSGHYKGPIDALEDVGAVWKDRGAQGSKVFKPLLFGQYENVKSVVDSNYGLYKRRKDGIDKIDNIYNKDIAAEALQGANLDPRYSDVLEADGMQLQEKYMGTPLEIVGQMTKMLKRQLRPYEQQLAALNNEKQRVEGNAVMKLEDRNKRVNELNDERKALTYQMLLTTRDFEDEVGSAIGDPDFSYDGFDPEDYVPQQ